MDERVLRNCLDSALKGQMSFPETVRHMAATGVERYRADLVTFEKCHYAASGETHIETIGLTQPPAIAAEFSADEVKAVISEIQQGAINYPEFLRRIMTAGTTDYAVYIQGQKAIYMGRNGESHVELFPAPKGIPEVKQ